MSHDVAPAPSLDASSLPDQRPAAGTARRVALTWVDEASIDEFSESSLDAVLSPYVPAQADLLADAPRRSPLRPGVLIPIGVIALLAGGYAATTLLWPLNAVAPEVTAIGVQPVAAPTTTPAWPESGSAAIEVEGIGSAVASTADVEQIASITKVVTALLVLEEMPLALGEQGPAFQITSADGAAYWRALANGESALDVPVGGTLTQYQLLEGMLIGSAGNYAERLANNLWPSDEVFADAAEAWLTAHGVPGITIVEPTGLAKSNVASPAALLPLAERALANPVIAEIVAKPSVDLPGAGHVTNTNPLLEDPGMLGLKTGTLDRYSLLSAKDITVGDTTVRLYASVLGQPDGEARAEASRALYTQLEQELQLRPSVVTETIAGRVETLWGSASNVVTTADADVVLWNGGSGVVTTTFSLGEHRDADDIVGALTVEGPLDSETVDLRLTADLEEPSAWWRLTHPLDLFGLNG